MLALKLALLLTTDADHDYHPPLTPLDQLSNINFGIGCFLIIAFTIFYGLRFRWWKVEATPGHPRGRINWAGISIFSIFVALSATLAYIVVTRLLTPGDYQFRDVFRLAVSFLLPAAGTLMFVALFLSRDQLLSELNAEAKAKSGEKDPTA